MRVLGFLLLLSLAACAPPEMLERSSSMDQTNNTSGDADAAAIKNGGALYDVYCVSCHGAEGAGGLTWPGNIQGYDPIATLVKDGRGTMPPVPITAEQTSDIQAYLNSFVVDSNNTPASNGEVLFDKYCVVCHGPAGTGAPTWTGSIQGFDPIRDIVKNGRGTMAAVPVTDAESDEIQAYLNSFGVDLTKLTGIEVYANQCATCHGPEGEGTADGPVIQFTVKPYGKWVTRNGRNGTGYPAAMIGYGTDRISEPQLDEVIDFLHAQTRPTTGEALYNTLCANCHGTGNQDGPAAESLAGRADSTSDIRAGHGGTNYGSRRIYMPKWSEAELSNDEVAAINTYLGEQ